MLLKNVKVEKKSKDFCRGIKKIKTCQKLMDIDPSKKNFRRKFKTMGDEKKSMLDVFESVKFVKPATAYAKIGDTDEYLMDESEFGFISSESDDQNCKNASDSKTTEKESGENDSQGESPGFLELNLGQKGSYTRVAGAAVYEDFNSCDFLSSDSEPSSRQDGCKEGANSNAQDSKGGSKTMDKILSLLEEVGLLQDFYDLVDSQGEIPHAKIKELLAPKGKIKNFKYLYIQRLLEQEIFGQ